MSFKLRKVEVFPIYGQPNSEKSKLAYNNDNSHHLFWWGSRYGVDRSRSRAQDPQL